jgi:membrane-bound lytic murein transglycosylase D
MNRTISTRSRAALAIRCLAFAMGGLLAAHADAPPPPPPADADDIYNAGKQLFDDYAPADVKEQYEFPSKEQWDAFAARFQRALDNNSLEGLAANGPEARSALAALRSLPGYEGYAEWLTLRLDEAEGAAQASKTVAPTIRKEPLVHTGQQIPYFDLWLARVRDRPVPVQAAALMPKLREAFIAGGVPPELAWIAEAESSLNPEAVSPAGATGLFQLTATTAKANGLSVFLPDERTHPEASARAAAHLLHQLKEKFGEWALALAAYNAGEGRVGRLLASRSATTFAEIASSLPAETRMYVPKVLALVQVRSGTTPDKLGLAVSEISHPVWNHNLAVMSML